MASYPTSIKTFTTKVDGIDDIMAAHVNDLQNEVNALETQLLASPIDYSSLSTIVGWSSFTTKQIWYRVIGNLVFVTFRIEGTSNSVNTSFTLPYVAGGTSMYFEILFPASDNDIAKTAHGEVSTGSQVFNMYSAWLGAGWTASGNKLVRGQFWYQKA